MLDPAASPSSLGSPEPHVFNEPHIVKEREGPSKSRIPLERSKEFEVSPELKKLLQRLNPHPAEPNCMCAFCNNWRHQSMSIESYVAALKEERDAAREQSESDLYLAREISRARDSLAAALSSLKEQNERLRRFETYVCQVIAMGNQADLTVEALPR